MITRMVFHVKKNGKDSLFRLSFRRKPATLLLSELREHDCDIDGGSADEDVDDP